MNQNDIEKVLVKKKGYLERPNKLWNRKFRAKYFNSKLKIQFI